VLHPELQHTEYLIVLNICHFTDCTDKPDCVGQIHCKHDEDFHCIDKQCACLKVHHGHGP
jgi:hypothetical protein